MKHLFQSLFKTLLSKKFVIKVNNLVTKLQSHVKMFLVFKKVNPKIQQNLKIKKLQEDFQSKVDKQQSLNKIIGA